LLAPAAVDILEQAITPVPPHRSARAASLNEVRSPLQFGVTASGVERQEPKAEFMTDLYSGGYSVMERHYAGKQVKVLKYYCDAATYFGVVISNTCAEFSPAAEGVTKSFTKGVEAVKKFKGKKDNGALFAVMKDLKPVRVIWMMIHHVLRPAITVAAAVIDGHDWTVSEDDESVKEPATRKTRGQPKDDHLHD
jgi:hypothetical protein